YKTISRDETISRFDRSDVSNGLRKPQQAASAANLSTVRLSSGISANILDFRLPQKHVLQAMPAWKPAARRVVVKARRNQQRHGAGARASVNPGEGPWEFRSSRPGQLSRRRKSRRLRQRVAGE